MLKKYTPNQVALFTRNPYWWGPKPHIQGFGLEFFTNDDTMIAGAPFSQWRELDEPDGKPLVE